MDGSKLPKNLKGGVSNDVSSRLDIWSVLEGQPLGVALRISSCNAQQHWMAHLVVTLVAIFANVSKALDLLLFAKKQGKVNLTTKLITKKRPRHNNCTIPT